MNPRWGIFLWLTTRIVAFGAQYPADVPPETTFRAGIKLVQVSVVAQDKKGQPVSDLRREEFQILDNGSPQEIRLFIAEKPGPSEPESRARGVFTNQFAAPAGSPGGYSVILIDSFFTDFGDPVKGPGGANARLSALRALRSIPGGGRIAIYATGRKLRVVCEFTSDRDLLERQLERWKPSVDTPDTANGVLLASLGATSKDRRGDAPDQALSATVQADAQLRAPSSDDEMDLIADHLAGVPGRKNLIWLSRRFVIGPRTLQKLSAASVAIYPVDIGGTPCDACNAIAALTGGIAYDGRNDIDVAIRDALDDGRVSYTLGFYESDNNRASGVHQLAVRVGRPGVALRYHTSYQPETLRPLPADPRADLVRAMNRPIDATAIPARASITRAKESLNLKAVIDAGSLELSQSGERWRGKMEIVTRFTAADGKPVGEVLTQTMNLHLSQAVYDAALQHGIACSGEMKIPSKAVELKLLFTDLVSGKIGTLTIPLSEVAAGGAK